MLHLIPNYLRTSFRSLARHKFSVSMSILGLSVAFGCCIVAWFNYGLNSTFDQSHVNAENIYRVNFNHEADGKTIVYGISPIPMGQLLKENFADIDEVARYEILDLPLKSGSELFTASVAFTDPGFTSMFTMPLLQGDHHIDGRNVLLSSKTAQKYFGTTDVVGKTITLIVNETTEEYQVAGVFESFGFNNSFKFEVLANIDQFFTSVSDKSITRENWKRWSTTFVLVKDPSRIKSIEKAMDQFVPVQNEARPDLKVRSFYLDPFEGMAARSRIEQTRGHWFSQPLPPAAVIIMFIVAMILLGTGCVNVINNTISIASTRFKEIGIRKTMGGRRVDIRYQFFIESALICVSALIVGFAFGEVFARAWDTIWHDIEFKINYFDPQFALFIAGVTVLTILLAGSYPAFFVARVQPMEVLKGKQKFGNSSFITKPLLVLQLSISIMAVIFNISFYRNSVYQENYDLGFSYHEVIQVPVDTTQFELLRNAIATNQQIESIGGSANHVSKGQYKAKVKVDESENEVSMFNVGENYFNTIDVNIIAGRDFGSRSEIDMKESVIVNQEFIKTLNIEGDPIGKRVLVNDSIPLYIVGVTEEIYINALFTPIEPVVFRSCAPNDYQWLTVRADKSSILEVNTAMEKTWNELFPTKLYPGTLMDAQLETTMNHFKNVSKLYSFLGFVTIVLAMTGLFAMISLHIRKKLKEIGLRKMLGGKAAHLSLVASRPFIIVVGVSLVIGTTAGVFVANLFLDYVWEYYQNTEWVIVTSAIAATVMLAVATVLSQVLSAVRVNPIDIIKEE